MRDQLMGYLLDALEPAEREAVEEQLQNDPQLQYELDLMYQSLDPLRADKGTYAPPPGLAERTCELVAVKAAVRVAPAPVVPPRSRWTMADMVVAAGIMLAASLLLFPAINQSRYNSQLAACQNNLRELGLSLAQYSQQHNDQFPGIQPKTNNQDHAGIYASRLIDEGYLQNPKVVLCPSSPQAAAGEHRVPSIGALQRATGEALAEMKRQGGGSYGYNMGYRDQQGYHSTRNLQRKNFAMMADAPSSDLPHFQSQNHGGHGQNVLFEDGHVAHMLSSTPVGGADEFFVNDQNQIDAGTHQDDAVIGVSSARPLRLISQDN